MDDFSVRDRRLPALEDKGGDPRPRGHGSARSVLRSPAPYLAAVMLVSMTGLSAGAATSTSLGPVPSAGATTATVAAASPVLSWFHDPVSAADRRAEISVPAHPTQYAKGRKHTKATFRTHGGAIAVPISWAKGHSLVHGQALALTSASLFTFDSAKPTRVARTELQQLAGSLSHVRAVRCEGYTDFGGATSHEKTLSQKRAAAICALVRKSGPAISTTSVGYGGKRPVIVGGSRSGRAQNRRVVIVVTSSSALTSAPSAPRLSTAVAGDAAATISFTKPTTTGGATVTSYQVSTNGGQTWQTVHPTGTSPFTVALSGLTNGTTYPVTVRAVNSAGHSAASNSLNVTPAAVPVDASAPSAPNLTAVVVHDASATITFAAPTSNGGSAVTGYEVSTDGGTTYSPVTTTGSSPFTVTVTGLTNGTAYAVTVRAMNSAGHSVASNSRDVTPSTVPSAPSLTSATAGDTTAGLTFAAPSSDGGTVLTGYEVSTDDGGTWTAVTTTGTSPFTVTVTGLTNGTAYSVLVRAVNAVGHSVASNSLSVTPVLVPVVASAPTILAGVANNGVVYSMNSPEFATLTFTTPTSNGGSAITGYQVTLNNGVTWTDAVYTPGTPNSMTVSVPYSYWYCYILTQHFQIRAVTAAGAGLASNDVTVVFADGWYYC